jgi:hypothetical protein
VEKKCQILLGVRSRAGLSYSKLISLYVVDWITGTLWDPLVPGCFLLVAICPRQSYQRMRPMPMVGSRWRRGGGILPRAAHVSTNTNSSNICHGSVDLLKDTQGKDGDWWVLCLFVKWPGTFIKKNIGLSYHPVSRTKKKWIV